MVLSKTSKKKSLVILFSCFESECSLLNLLSESSSDQGAYRNGWKLLETAELRDGLNTISPPPPFCGW